MAESCGSVQPSGTVEGVVSPTREAAPGVHFQQLVITVRLEDDVLSARLLGTASYRGRTVTVTEDLDPNELGKRLGATLRRVLSDHEDDLQAKVMEAGYEAALIARRRGE
jgi:hypothetical protein